MIITMPVKKLPPEGNKLANLLYEEREKRKLSKRELGKLSGVSRTTIMLIETGQRGDEVGADTLIKLANAMEISATPFLEAMGSKYEDSRTKPVDYPVATEEEWDKHAARRPLRVNVYSDYAKVHAGTPVEVIGHLYVDRPEKAPYNIKAYRVEGDCMEPDYRDGEFVIVDHDLAIENGDRVVALCDGQLHIAKLKIIGSEYWLQNRYSTKKMTDCQGVAKVIGHYGK